MNANPGSFTRDTIQEIADRTERDAREVRAVYEDELAAADAQARVKTFVPIFARRRALERLKERGTRSPRR
ncbi:MAG TPA: DUF3562 domain-containing protein [Usitatibacter sp.]|jgi:hypothetical protein|nr:DUF3562 domain-containing protein [Usitatibacter sp.]